MSILVAAGFRDLQTIYSLTRITKPTTLRMTGPPHAEKWSIETLMNLVKPTVTNGNRFRRRCITKPQTGVGIFRLTIFPREQWN